MHALHQIPRRVSFICICSVYAGALPAPYLSDRYPRGGEDMEIDSPDKIIPRYPFLDYLLSINIDTVRYYLWEHRKYLLQSLFT